MTTDSPESLLALHGGPKTFEAPPPPRRLFGVEEKEAVMQLFDRAIEEGSHILGYNGVEEESYCREFAEFMGGGFADGVNSGTNAVFVALRALELEPFSEVITPPVSDPGGVMPVALCNLIPVPADSVPGQYNTGAEQIEARITPRTRAILVAHISGHPVDMEPVMALARRHGLHVIEDCAQAHGATIRCSSLCTDCKEAGATVCRGRKAGTFGDVAAFSTMFGKHHATGGQGGIVFTRNEDIYWRVRRHADRGKPFGISLGAGAGAGVGSASAGGANAVAALNCNMDELHACIGRVQLGKLPGFIAGRRDLAARIQDGCGSLAGVRLEGDPPHGKSCYWFLLLRFDADAYRVNKAQFVEALTAEGIPCLAGYRHYPSRMIWSQRQQVFGTSGLPWRGGPAEFQNAAEYPLPNAEAVDAVHFLIFSTEEWSSVDADLTVAALQKVDAAYRKI